MVGSAPDLRHSLSHRKEIEISVLGRKSGKWIARPVWFVLEDNTVYLLPVEGTGTQWFKNLLQNSKLRISAGEAKGEFNVTPVTDAKAVSTVAEKFRSKYSAGDIKKYYSKLDVAIPVKIA